MRRLIGAAVIVGIVLLIGAILLVYAAGKRINQDGKLVGTGIIQIGTTPNQASIFLDNNLRGKSDTNLENIKPGKYTLRLEKDHYHTWEKQIEVKEGLVTPLKITLFPTNPSLTAITFEGVSAPQLSLDKKKVVFGIVSAEKAGLWVIDLTDRQLFFDSSHLRQIAADTKEIPFSKATLQWSADSSSVLAQVLTTSGQNQSFLLKQDQLNNSLTDISSSVDNLKSSWQKSISGQNNNLLKNLGVTAVTLAKDAAALSFSKDNSGVIIINQDKSATVYDSKPSLLPSAKPLTYTLPVADNYFWFNDDTKHIVAVEKNTISLMDNDGGNKISIFTGDFDASSVYSWPDGSRMVISINLNSKANPLPNLYTIDLR